MKKAVLTIALVMNASFFSSLFAFEKECCPAEESSFLSSHEGDSRCPCKGRKGGKK